METYRIIITEGLDAGIAPFRGFEHIYYKGKKKLQEFEKNGIKFRYAPIQFSLDTIINEHKAQFSSAIAQEQTESSKFILLRKDMRANMRQWI